MSTRPPAPAEARGFTLLEVMVALAVLATAFTALLGLHIRNLDLVGRESQYLQSVFLARSLIAEVELRGHPPVGSTTGDFEQRFPGEYIGFRWEQLVLDTPLPNTREVSVRVIPPLGAGAAARLTLFVRPEQQG